MINRNHPVVLDFSLFSLIFTLSMMNQLIEFLSKQPNLKRRFIMAYTCKNCGAVANEPGHLCNPCGDAKKCSFCGSPDVDTAHMCKDKLASMKFVCDGCGRVAMEETHLCKPSPIG